MRSFGSRWFGVRSLLFLGFGFVVGVLGVCPSLHMKFSGRIPDSAKLLLLVSSIGMNP